MDQELKQILSQCSLSTRMTALTFFPERFYMPFAKEVHGKIFDLIDGPEQKVAIAAPRGYGKTSIVALGLMARWILFHHTASLSQVTAPSSSGATIVSAKGGTTYNFSYKNASFTYNAASYYCIIKRLR